jgi:GNAT superfamily N-acetyltransferase
VYSWIRIKYGFWFFQPVFHTYDLFYYFSPNRIIQKELPRENKFINFKEIEVLQTNSLKDEYIQKITDFISINFHRKGSNIFEIKRETFEPYFIGHNYSCFYSFFYKDKLYDSENNVISQKKLIGFVSTRPLYVQILDNKTRKTEKMIVYYADYLCVAPEYRKKGIAPQLIQTQEYVQRHSQSRILVSLFKREGEVLKGVVPLCSYFSFCFYRKVWAEPAPIKEPYFLEKVDNKNIHIIFEFMKQKKYNFTVFIISELTNILELIKTNNLFIYFLSLRKNSEDIISVYFFKKSCMQIDNEKEALTCIATIDETNNLSLFIQGFKNAFWRIIHSENQNFGYSVIEDISDNNKIIQNMKIKTDPYIISPTSYFLYNYICHKTPSSDVFIVC